MLTGSSNAMSLVPSRVPEAATVHSARSLPGAPPTRTSATAPGVFVVMVTAESAVSAAEVVDDADAVLEPGEVGRAAVGDRRPRRARVAVEGERDVGLVLGVGVLRVVEHGGGDGGRRGVGGRRGLLGHGVLRRGRRRRVVPPPGVSSSATDSTVVPNHQASRTTMASATSGGPPRAAGAGPGGPGVVVEVVVRAVPVEVLVVLVVEGGVEVQVVLATGAGDRRRATPRPVGSSRRSRRPRGGPGGGAASRCRSRPARAPGAGRTGWAAAAGPAARPWRMRWTGRCPGSAERARRIRAARSGWRTTGGRSGRPSGPIRPACRAVRQNSRSSPRAAMSPCMVPVAAGTARSPTRPLGRSTTVSGADAADRQTDAVRLGDALGQPAQDGAGLALGHRALGEPLGHRAALDPLVDDVGGAAGRRGVPAALRRVVDHRQRGGGQPAGGQRAADPGAGGRPAGGVDADGDVAVEHPVPGTPAPDHAGGGGLLGADLVEGPVAVGQTGDGGRHRRSPSCPLVACGAPAPLRAPRPPAAGHPRRLRARTAASGPVTSGTRASSMPPTAATPMTTVPMSRVPSEPATESPSTLRDTIVIPHPISAAPSDATVTRSTGRSVARGVQRPQPAGQGDVAEHPAGDVGDARHQHQSGDDVLGVDHGRDGEQQRHPDGDHADLDERRRAGVLHGVEDAQLQERHRHGQQPEGPERQGDPDGVRLVDAGVAAGEGHRRQAAAPAPPGRPSRAAGRARRGGCPATGPGRRRRRRTGQRPGSSAARGRSAARRR